MATTALSSTEGEGKEFEKAPDEAKKCHESAVRIAAMWKKELGKEESHGKE
jgi:hypothetical protein